MEGGIECCLCMEHRQSNHQQQVMFDLCFFVILDFTHWLTWMNDLYVDVVMLGV